MKASILKQTLFAGTHVCGVNDERSYLNGIYLEFRAGQPFALLVATDRHVMGLNRLDILEPATESLSIVVPSDVVKSTCKDFNKRGAAECVELEVGNARCVLGDRVFTPLEGQYPAWRRVVPSLESLCVPVCTEGKWETPFADGYAQFNPELLLRAFKFLERESEAQTLVTTVLSKDRRGAAVMHRGTFAQVVIMPMRHETTPPIPYADFPKE